MAYTWAGHGKRSFSQKTDYQELDPLKPDYVRGVIAELRFWSPQWL